MSQVYGNNKFDAQIRRFGGSNKAEGTGLGKGKIEFTKAKEFKGFQKVCSEEGCFLAGSDSINQIIFYSIIYNWRHPKSFLIYCSFFLLLHFSKRNVLFFYKVHLSYSDRPTV